MTFIPNVYGKLSSSNSGALATAIGVGFTGTYELVTNYTNAVISIVIGANEQVTITINYSINAGGSVKTTETIDIAGPETHIIPIKSQYFQIIVTNVTTITLGSEIQTIFNTGMKMPVENVSRTVENSSDSILTKSVLYGKYRNTYVPLSVESPSEGSLRSHISGPVDAFNRVRTSDNYALFSGSFLTDNDPYRFDTLTSGSGTTSYTQGYPHVVMSVNGVGRAVRQQHGYNIYQPGKSLLVLMTGTILSSGAPATCVGRIGYFDNANDKNATIDDSPTGDGFFFEATGNGTSNPDMSIVYRTSNRISGAIVQTDTTIQRANWNIDKLDGSGPSGLNFSASGPLRFSQRQIYIMELEWLGVGDVVLGIFYNRQPVPCHKFSFTGGEYAPNGPGGIPYPELAYMTRASLPVRYEIQATGIGTATMYQICCSVVSEGGIQPTGKKYSGPTYVINLPKSITNSATSETQMYALRINKNTSYPMRPRVTIKVTGLSVVCISSANILVRCFYIKSPATSPVTGGTWVNGSTAANCLKYSAVEYNITSTGTTINTSTTLDIRCVYNQVLSANGNITANTATFREPITLVSDIQGVSDEFLITCTVASAAETAYVCIDWEEYE